jgi:glycosyltransferase involved in cell wall biosynthesis
VPLVTVVHTTSHSNPESVARPAQEKWLIEILSGSARVICVSHDVRRALEHLAPDLRLEVIGNASRFRPSDRSGSVADRKVLSYIGRTGHAKGVDDFFRIARSLADTELKFLCNGLYPDILELSESAPENVEICHSLDAEGMLRLYCRSHAIIATYRSSEGLPLALLEALSLGVPVLGYGSPGVMELLDGHDQFVAPIGDHQAIVRRIRAWLGGEADFTRPQAEIVPHWSRTAPEYLRVFREVAP